MRPTVRAAARACQFGEGPPRPTLSGSPAPGGRDDPGGHPGRPLPGLADLVGSRHEARRSGRRRHRRGWLGGPVDRAAARRGGCDRCRRRCPRRGGGRGRRHARRGVPLALDVTSSAEWDEAVARIVADHGRLDVLVNNAATHTQALVESMSDEEWDRVMRTNAHSVFYGCRAAVPAMRAGGGGSIVNVVTGQFGVAYSSAYTSSKFLVHGFSQCLVLEVARYGIRVNCVAPGAIPDTGFERWYREKAALVGQEYEAFLDGTLDAIPLHRFGRPEDIAGASRTSPRRERVRDRPAARDRRRLRRVRVRIAARRLLDSIPGSWPGCPSSTRTSTTGTSRTRPAATGGSSPTGCTRSSATSTGSRCSSTWRSSTSPRRASRT